jgi:hypothetical protein
VIGTRCFNEIRKWVKDLGDDWCFCPEKADAAISRSNITSYISSPGTDMGAINETAGVRRVLRHPIDSKTQRPIENSVGDLISKEFGGELRLYCHFGKESSIIPLLLRDMMGMQVDLRPILHRAPIYDTRKHILKLGLGQMLPGLLGHDDPQAGALLQDFAWQSVTNSVMSSGLGVNMWALLTLAAMIGCTEIHTKNSSRFASSALSCILSMAPSSATPGKMIPVRSFNANTTTHEYIPIAVQPGKAQRNEHFIRPAKDNHFAHGGTHTFCPVVDGLAPEDYLGCGHVAAMAKLICCKYIEVPAKYLRGFYQLVPGRHYALYKHPNDADPEAREGTLIINKSSVQIAHWAKGDREGEVTSAEFAFTDWHEALHQKELLVLPMVFRQGAGVWVKGGAGVGCLVSDGTAHSIADGGGAVEEGQFVSNFDHVRHCYSAMVDECEYEAMDPEEVIEKLIPPGTMLWLKPGSTTWGDLQRYFPARPATEGGEDNRALAVRLDFPLEDDYTPGMLCVIVLQRKYGSVRMQAPEYEHYCVNPWELVPVGTEGFVELRELHT